MLPDLFLTVREIGDERRKLGLHGLSSCDLDTCDRHGQPPYRVEETGGWSRTSTKLVRSRSHGWVKKDKHWVLSNSRTNTSPEGDATHDRMLQSARRAAKYRAGNCAEHAAVVYAYLWEKARGKGSASSRGSAAKARRPCLRRHRPRSGWRRQRPQLGHRRRSWSTPGPVRRRRQRHRERDRRILRRRGRGRHREGAGYINYHDVRILCEFDSDA